MKKTIYIGENNLVNLKNAMADSNVGHSNSAGISDEMLSFLLNNKPSISSRWAVVFGSFFKYFEKKSYATYYYKFLSRGNKGKVKLIDLDNFSLFEENKPPYEDDEYTIGGEGGNNDFFHINSKKQITESARADLDAIDSISFTVDEKYNFDEEEYSHWWDYYDTEEEYLKSCEYYDGEVYDTDGHLIEYFGGDRDEVEYYFADNLNIAEKIFNRDAILRGNTYWITDIQDELVNEINVDINNVDEVNKAAKKLSKPNGASLFVLIDGSIISFHDHAQIQSVCDGMTISKFLELGNIRCGGGNVVTIQLIKEPTFYQRHTLKNMLEYADEAIVDFAEPNKYDNMYPEVVHSVSYRSPNPERVVNDIVYYFVEGIMPVNESKEEGKNILTESQESKSIAAAKKLVMQRLGYNEQEADEFIRIKLRNDIPSLRTPQGGKFILGVTRMFCDGELRTANDIGNLNSTLKLVASDAHINEYDRNLNGMPAQELIQRFAKAMSDNIEAEKNEIGQMTFDTTSDYEIVRIDSFEQAEEYGDYVSWCVTHDEDMFDSYTSDGINQFYFCLKNGFENVEEVPSEGCPLDEYGLSMIAVSVNENGMLNTCTCRWNHDNDGDDSIMNAKEVSQIIGMNFFEVFKPNNKWKELLANVEQRLAKGEDQEDVFDMVYYLENDFSVVELNGKHNFINQEGKIISSQWFDSVYNFYNGFAVVELNRKYNFINQEGKIISSQWFDNAGNFVNGFADVELNHKFNFINQEGKLLCDQWFDSTYGFNNGFAAVKLNDNWNFINQEGRLISGQWFDSVDDFTNNGFAWVTLNGKCNYINQEGRLISDQWFDVVRNFINGFAWVKLNGKCNLINQEGRLISDQWFDSADNFTNNGFAWVKLNGKCNLINQEGRLISDQWFDYVNHFSEGFAAVGLNDNWNFINQEGKIISSQWFDSVDDFYNGFADVMLNGKHCRLDANGNLAIAESKNKNKKIVVSENQLKTIKENLDLEVDSSEVDLSSFKKKHELAPNIWKPNGELNSRVRLKLLDISDDFWDFANITWVKRKGIHLTGSICNFNWSKFSDIDLHIVVDFSEIDERKEFVQEYFDSKKNEWNNEHSNLKIYGYPVELYVEDVNAETTSNGIYDLEENDWVKKPNPDDVSSIGLNKFSIKERAAEIMTKIDDLYDEFKSTDDDAKLREIGKKAKKLLNKIKTNRKYGLNRNGESDTMNIVYKCLRRTGYIDMLWDLSSELYDKINSIDINESINLSDIDVFSLAKKHFGITRDIRECGYILPDGSMLDFSGRHYITGNTDSSHLNGRRSSDHRDIYEIGWDGNTKKFSYKMEDFIRAGAIRIHASSSYSSINLFKKPTKEQENILIRLIQYSKGNVIVEIGDGDNSYSYAEYDNVRPRRIISDIIKYFDEGINLIGNVIENRIIDIAERFIKERTINEEVVADGNSSHNPFKKRWKHEKDMLKNYLVNYGEIMTSKENGKQYKVLYDQTLSSRLGINYCICIQWNQITMEPGNIMYVRAYDMFTKKLFRPQFDTRGFDNVAGTSDDTVSY